MCIVPGGSPVDCSRGIIFLTADGNLLEKEDLSDLTTVSVLKSPRFPFLLLLKAKPAGFLFFLFFTLVKEDLQLFNAKTKSRRTTGPIIDPVTRVELVGETLPSLCPHQWLATTGSRGS